MAVLVTRLEAEDRTKRGIQSAQRRLGGLGGTLRGPVAKGAKVAALGIAGVGIAGVGIGVKLAKDFLTLGDQIHKMSIRTGVSAESLQKLKFAAEQSGSSIETLEKGILRSTRVIQDARDGLASATDTFDALNLSVEDLDGLNPEEQFNLLADAVAGIEDPTKRAAIAQELFGKSGAELIPLLEGGSAGIKQLTDEAERNGNIMSSRTVAATAKFNDTLNTLKQKGLAVALRGFEAILPHIVKFAGYVSDVVVPPSASTPGLCSRT